MPCAALTQWGVWLSNGTAAPLATAAALPGAAATLAPNPARTATTLTAAGLPPAASRLTATLHDALGRPVQRLHLPVAAGAVRAEVPTNHLPAGLYLLRLEAHDAQGARLGPLPTQRLLVE